MFFGPFFFLFSFVEFGKKKKRDRIRSRHYCVRNTKRACSSIRLNLLSTRRPHRRRTPFVGGLVVEPYQKPTTLKQSTRSKNHVPNAVGIRPWRQHVFPGRAVVPGGIRHRSHQTRVDGVGDSDAVRDRARGGKTDHVASDGSAIDGQDHGDRFALRGGGERTHGGREDDGGTRESGKSESLFYVQRTHAGGEFVPNAVSIGDVVRRRRGKEHESTVWSGVISRRVR